MRSLGLPSSLLAVAAILLSVADSGCTKTEKSTTQAKAKIEPKTVSGEAKGEAAHGGWWCQEHGVPEEMCSICMSEAAAKKMFKDKADWCKIHDRAQSQCFKCDPSLYEKVFVPMYVAKTGKKPERPPETEFIDETKREKGKT
jgi:hypothetical protein